MRKMFAVFAILGCVGAVWAEGSVAVPTVAVMNFEARTRDTATADTGKSVAELLTVSLLESGCADLVERSELNKALTELHLSAVGLTDRESQVKLGRLVGAKILITGSLFRAGEKNFLVAKIIGTETTRVIGASVSGNGDFVEMVPQLADKISAIVKSQSDRLLPAKKENDDVYAALATRVTGNKRKVFVQVKEDIQVSVPDPAAETELKKLLLALGFEITSARENADFAVIGEALASNAGSFQTFTSAAARVELSVFDRNGKLLATGAMRETLAGGSYVIAAKESLAQCTLKLAETLLLKLK